MIAVLRAMFAPPAEAAAFDQALREAWTVFDPLGLGRLSLREFTSACGLLGVPASEEDIAREFRRIDRDASRAIELDEFGVTLRRLAGLAKGQTRQELHSGASSTVASRVGGELQLLRLVDLDLRRAIPLSHHAFAGRVIANMLLVGYTPAQAVAVLRAVFDPLDGSGDWDIRRSAAARNAWVLLGGTDWFRLRVLEDDEPADDAAPGSPTSVAAKEEVLLPPPLRGGRAPRRSDFTEASEMRLRDFRALVRLFGDYMQDREMWNCQADSRPTH